MARFWTAIWLFGAISTLWSQERAALESFTLRYCLECHDDLSEEGGLDLLPALDGEFLGHRETWETVIRRLRSRQMPPAGEPRPDEKTYENVLANLESQLDNLPVNPGRTGTFRRLTRTEYKNAIRDLLGIEVDPAKWLPKDESSHGFDNITVGDLSPTLLNRYVSAAQEIARVATGAQTQPEGRVVRLPADLTQEDHVEGLPLGTRGGTLIEHHFPRSGEYEIEVRLTRDRNEHVEGLKGQHQLEILLNNEPKKSFTLRPPKGGHHSEVDKHLNTRVSVEAGSHTLGVTFVKKPSSLIETKRQPYEAHFNMHRHPRQNPAVFQISITGPFEAEPAPEKENPEAWLTEIMRRSYRRPITETDLERPMQFFEEGGLEMALSSILVSSNFLLRVEKDPPELESGAIYELSDLELASRLSFFLWSSIPDETLLAVAEKGQLSDPAELEKQARRMLADPKADALVSSFANQWLHLRNLDSITPDARLFVDFDENLRQAMKRETELHFESVLREDRSVVDLLKTDRTFLNERLAKHYGIPHIYGTRFRPVALGPNSQRGGLLRHGSILTVTSYANRTSPVLRGNWILENILGTPPPPPPPDVPALEENTVAANLSVRERLAEHRKNAQCAVCHDVMDPPGLAMENFDAVGRWRELENGEPIDSRGGLPDGSEFSGVEGLESALLERPELFVTAMTEKLMTYALGRGVEHYDGPAIRNIVRESQPDGYRFSSIVTGIVKSAPFTMRTAE